jgi:hypothetical protein
MQEPTKKDENRFKIIEGKQKETDIALDNHTEMLKEISGTVDRIEQIVASHSTMFTAHKKLLETLVTLGNAHTELFHAQEETLHNHTEVLNEHTALLKQILEKL